MSKQQKYKQDLKYLIGVAENQGLMARSADKFAEIKLSNLAKRIIKWNQVIDQGKTADEIKLRLQDTLTLEEMVETAVASNSEELSELDRIVEIYDGLCDTFVTLSYYSYISGVDYSVVDIVTDAYQALSGQEDILYNLLLCLEDVIESNWTKFPLMQDFLDNNPFNTDPVTALKAQSIAIENTTNYTGVCWEVREVGDTQYLIFLDENGKAMKPYTYREPNIKAIITEAI